MMIIIIIIIITKVIPVITGSIGSISKSSKQYLSNAPGRHYNKELQKTATFGTAHTVRKIQM